MSVNMRLGNICSINPFQRKRISHELCMSTSRNTSFMLKAWINFLTLHISYEREEYSFACVDLEEP